MDAPHKTYLIHHPDHAEQANPIAAMLGDSLVGRTSADADAPIDLGDAEVVLVVVTTGAFRSARVDAELAKALQLEGAVAHAALVGVLHPDYDYPGLSKRTALGADEMLRRTEPKSSSWWPHDAPQRLAQAVIKEYAVMRPWPDDAEALQTWVHDAAQNHGHVPPPPLGAPMSADLGADVVGWKAAGAPKLEDADVRLQGK